MYTPCHVTLAWVFSTPCRLFFLTQPFFTYIHAAGNCIKFCPAYSQVLTDSLVRLKLFSSNCGKQWASETLYVVLNFPDAFWIAGPRFTKPPEAPELRYMLATWHVCATASFDTMTRKRWDEMRWDEMSSEFITGLMTLQLHAPLSSSCRQLV